MFKDNLSSIVIGAAIIIGAFLIRPSASGPFQAVGYDGVIYRLNQQNGRVDVLVPTSEGALFMPVGQIAPPKNKMTDEEKSQFSGFLKAVGQYLQIERAKQLGLKIIPAPAPDSKGKTDGPLQPAKN